MTLSSNTALAGPPPGNIINDIIFSNYSCTNDSTLVGTFGQMSCTDFIAMAPDHLRDKLRKSTRHIIAFLYEGVLLQVDATNPTGFCQTRASGNATDPAVPLTFATPLCNLADPILSPESTGDINHRGESCGNSIASPVFNPPSKGLCDFAPAVPGSPYPVDVQKMCPKETTWINSLRPQAFQAAVESIEKEFDDPTGGHLRLTALIDPNTNAPVLDPVTHAPIRPCGGFGRSISRIVDGVPAAGSDPGIPSLAAMRSSVLTSNKNSGPDEFKIDVHSDCSGASAQAMASDTTGGGAAPTTFSNMACQLVYAHHYVEFLIGQAALCEMNLRADAAFNKLFHDPVNGPAATFSMGISKILGTCKDYAAAKSGIDYSVPNMIAKKKSAPFWSDPTVRGFLYDCYNRGNGSTSPVHSGIYKWYRKWINDFMPLTPSKGLALAPDGLGANGNDNAFPKLPKMVEVPDTGPNAKPNATHWEPVANKAPYAATDHPLCGLFLLPALGARRRFNKRKLLLKLLVAATVLLSAGQLSLSNAQASGLQSFVHETCPGGSEKKVPMDPNCVCSVKTNACLFTQEQLYEKAVQKVYDDYNTHMNGDCSDAGKDRDCTWNNDTCAVDCDKNAGWETAYCIATVGFCAIGSGICSCNPSFLSTGGCWCSDVRNYAREHCQMTEWYDPVNGRDRKIQDKINTDAIAACKSIYAGPGCDQGPVMDFPPGDPSLLSDGLLGCYEQATEIATTSCPPKTPDPNSPTPHAGVTGSGAENQGETALLGSRELAIADGGPHQAKVMPGPNNNNTGGAATASEALLKRKTAAAATASPTDKPTATPNAKSATTEGGTTSTQASGGPDVGGAGGPADVSTGDNSGTNAATAGLGPSGGFEAGGPGGGSRRSNSANGLNESRGNMGVTFGLHNGAGAGGSGADGSLGPNGGLSNETDGNEPYLLKKDVSIFEVVNRRYKKRTPSMVVAASAPGSVPAPAKP
ncbi:MAG: hypothetical protein HY074_19060 [Deltaproteobacteria bacterium]|nr:hypothetical protein [Deltaproteobacteria bacterium]